VISFALFLLFKSHVGGCLLPLYLEKIPMLEKTPRIDRADRTASPPNTFFRGSSVKSDSVLNHPLVRTAWLLLPWRVLPPLHLLR